MIYVIVIERCGYSIFSVVEKMDNLCEAKLSTALEYDSTGAMQCTEQ
jgi:hypothetical protein